MSEIKRLEEWKSKHKMRAVEIGIDNGYGSSSWDVLLTHEHGRTYAVEGYYDPDYDRPPNDPKGHVRAENKEVPHEWAGLEFTIKTALDAFENGIWGPHP